MKHSSFMTILLLLLLTIAIPSNALQIPFFSNNRQQRTAAIANNNNNNNKPMNNNKEATTATIKKRTPPLSLMQRQRLARLSTIGSAIGVMTPPLIPSIAICSGMDLMCLMNTVTANSNNSNNNNNDMTEALHNSLTDQRHAMVDRITDIDYILPTIAIRKHANLEQSLLATLHMDDSDSSSRVKRTPPLNNVVATQWDALSHTEYNCILNQIIPQHGRQQQLAIIQTLQQERMIATARLEFIDDGLKELLVVTADETEIDEIETPSNRDTQSLLDSIQQVLTMEQEEVSTASSTTDQRQYTS